MSKAPPFSIQVFLLTFFLLTLSLGGTLWALTIKTETRMSSKPSLHAIVVPLHNNPDNNDLEKKQTIIKNTQEEQTTEKPKLSDISKGLVSIIIYDYGLSKTHSQSIIEYGIEGLSLSLSPYTERPIYWIDTARQFNQEVWNSLYISAGKSRNDYGPLTIKPSNRKEFSQKQIEVSLKHSHQESGALIYYDATKPMKELIWAMEAISSKSLSSVLISKSYDIGDEQLSTNLWLDYNEPQEKITELLTSLSRKAKKEGYALAALPPTSNVLKELQEWQGKMASSEISLVPLSTLMEATQR